MGRLDRMVRCGLVGCGLLTLVSAPLVADDAVLRWNAYALQAVREDRSSLPVASRNLAMVHAAIYDTVNSVIGARKPLYTVRRVGGPVSLEAAVTAAAHRVLSHVYPQQAGRYDHILLESYQRIPDGDEKKSGIRLGREVGEAIIAWRSGDKSPGDNPYTRKANMGQWKPASPQEAGIWQWGWLDTFMIPHGAHYRPAAPPPLQSEEYTQVFYDVKRVGQYQTRGRTDDQTASALFWEGIRGTPAGYWNAVARQISQDRELDLEQNAQLFALLNAAVADAAIAAWDCKYNYCFWRPIDAIQGADADGNGATRADPAWRPLLTAPLAPDYVSGYSATSAAAATVLTAYFGVDIPFSSDGEGEPGTVRRFQSFNQAAEEAGRSRVLGGVNFQTANEAGLRLGRQVAVYCIQNGLCRRGNE